MYDKVIGEEVLRVVFLVREVAIGPVHSGPKWWSGRRIILIGEGLDCVVSA